MGIEHSVPPGDREDGLDLRAFKDERGRLYVSRLRAGADKIERECLRRAWWHAARLSYAPPPGAAQRFLKWREALQWYGVVLEQARAAAGEWAHQVPDPLRERLRADPVEALLAMPIAELANSGTGIRFRLGDWVPEPRNIWVASQRVVPSINSSKEARRFGPAISAETLVDLMNVLECDGREGFCEAWRATIEVVKQFVIEGEKGGAHA